ncbi:MAG: hypothetical protein LAKADJCE_01014 [Candidatus Argoarchaeum ethanivorans]|uniref:Uncharacterized protein n=1 Tax=Candidatus Argoarchaeum ethanivorans TaxID=2608793 RepID=A0A811TGT0_9EURY|nr:MAG: hypothetical protein LAKADJCE_01014 [Candidatus Argoarchaeum ethanivorans]
MDASPFNTTAPRTSEEIAVIIRRVVPEFPTSTTSSGVATSPCTPAIRIASPTFSTSAPNARHACIVLCVSSETRGFSTVVFLASEAIAIARCV